MLELYYQNKKQGRMLKSSRPDLGEILHQILTFGQILGSYSGWELFTAPLYITVMFIIQNKLAKTLREKLLLLLIILTSHQHKEKAWYLTEKLWQNIQNKILTFHLKCGFLQAIVSKILIKCSNIVTLY